jgi:hypothetical protein
MAYLILLASKINVQMSRREHNPTCLQTCVHTTNDALCFRYPSLCRNDINEHLSVIVFRILKRYDVFTIDFENTFLLPHSDVLRVEVFVAFSCDGGLPEN